jgi:hypothetical protein
MTTGNRELTLNETFSRPDSRVQRLHPEPAALTLKCQTLRPVFIGWERLFESALNPRRYALYVHQAAVTCVSYPVVNRPVRCESATIQGAPNCAKRQM